MHADISANQFPLSERMSTTSFKIKVPTYLDIQQAQVTHGKLYVIECCSPVSGEGVGADRAFDYRVQLLDI